MVIFTGLLRRRRDGLELFDQAQIDGIGDRPSANRRWMRHVRIVLRDRLWPRFALEGGNLLPEVIQHRVGRRVPVVPAAMHFAAGDDVDARRSPVRGWPLASLAAAHPQNRPLRADLARPADPTPHTIAARCAPRPPSWCTLDSAASNFLGGGRHRLVKVALVPWRAPCCPYWRRVLPTRRRKSGAPRGVPLPHCSRIRAGVVRISYGPDSTADALLHEFSAARRFAWRQSQCCTLFKRTHYPALTSIERERLSRKNLHMAAKDWLPATVQAAGANRKLKAGQALFRRGGRTVGLYRNLEWAFAACAHRSRRARGEPLRGRRQRHDR